MDWVLLATGDPPQSPDGGVVALAMTIGTAVGGAVVWIAKMWMDWKERQRKEKLEDAQREREDEDRERHERATKEKTIVDHLTTLTDRLEKENMELQKEMADVRKELTRVTAHVMYLEGVMEAKNIKFRRFGPPPVPVPTGLVSGQSPAGPVEPYGPPAPGAGQQEEE